MAIVCDGEGAPLPAPSGEGEDSDGARQADDDVQHRLHVFQLPPCTQCYPELCHTGRGQSRRGMRKIWRDTGRRLSAVAEL